MDVLEREMIICPPFYVLSHPPLPHGGEVEELEEERGVVDSIGSVNGCGCFVPD